MGATLVFEGPRKLVVTPENDPPVADDEVRVRTLFSGISAGTELTLWRGTNPYLAKNWDPERRLFVPPAADATNRPGYPKDNWGYEEVGEIVEVGAGVRDLARGQRVYGKWGHRTHKVLKAEYARARILAPHVNPILGIFSQIGAISLNGILDAQINLGETVAIFGLGVIGQILAQLARLSGARVIVVDMIESRLDLARKLGTEHVIHAGAGSAAEAIKALTGNRGADVCIEASGSTAALNEAIRACAYSSKVVALGFFQGEAKGLYLGEEYHHNRVDLVCSQIFGVNPALKYRWDELRLITEFMKLVADGRLQLEPLITRVKPFEEGAALFAELEERPQDVIQAAMSFDGAGSQGR